MKAEKTCPIMPKHLLVHHHPDGQGRDLYIRHPEGAPMVENNQKKNFDYLIDFKQYASVKRTSNLPNLRRPPVTVKYHYDGGGRDSFIGSNNGGFLMPDEYNPHMFFKKLREPDLSTMPQSSKRQTSIELENRIRRRKMSPSESKFRIKLKDSVNRLSKPKERMNESFENPKKTTYRSLYGYKNKIGRDLLNRTEVSIDKLDNSYYDYQYKPIIIEKNDTTGLTNQDLLQYRKLNKIAKRTGIMGFSKNMRASLDLGNPEQQQNLRGRKKKVWESNLNRSLMQTRDNVGTACNKSRANGTEAQANIRSRSVPIQRKTLLKQFIESKVFI